MILRPVLMLIPPEEGLTGPERVLRQREFARRALSRCAELCGVQDGDWPKGPDEAPLPRNGLHWSISHKPTCVAAVIADRPVGIDVERVIPRPRPLFDAVADDAEWCIAGGRNWPAFFRVWTAKEATLKAHGVGIGHMRECRLMVAVTAPAESLQLSFRGILWRTHLLTEGDHLAAVTDVSAGLRWHVEIASSPVAAIR